MSEEIVQQPSKYIKLYKSNQAHALAEMIFLQLTLLAIIFLPFTKGLTLSIGFPLKVYEVVLPIAMPILLLSGSVRGSNNFWCLVLLSIVFFMTALTSTLAEQFSSSLNTSLNFRGGQFVDGIMRLTYLLFNIAVLLMAYQATSKAPLKVLKFWFIGLFISFSYHLITVIFFLLHGDAPLLPGIERHQLGWVGDFLIPRSGTFEEGNFAGLYYLASLALAFYSRNKFMMVVATCGVMITLSTSAYLALTIFLLVYWIKQKRFSITNLLRIILMCTLIIVSLLQLDVASKFNADAGSSAMVRLNEIMTGINIFLAHPFFGVGLGGYGYYFDAMEWNSALSQFFEGGKHISNNVYIELLAETGVVGFIFYLSIMFTWLGIILKGGFRANCFMAFFIALLVAFVVYPTFNITYIWFFIGLTAALTRTVVNHRLN